MKFNHNEGDVTKAVGMDTDELTKHLSNVAVRTEINPDTGISNAEKVAILTAISGHMNLGELVVVLLDGLKIVEMDSQSELIEYLYKNLDNKAYKELMMVILPGL